MSLFKHVRTAAKATVAVAAAISIAVGVLIKPWEGVSYTPYKDVGGVWTVCHGHTGNDIIKNKVYTPAECDKLLTDDVEIFADGVNRLIKVPISDETRASLISFAYNVGLGNVAKSDVLRQINAGHTAKGCQAIAKKDYSTGQCRGYGCGYVKGKMYRGLQNRRQSEKKLCMKNIAHNI